MERKAAGSKKGFKKEFKDEWKKDWRQEMRDVKEMKRMNVCAPHHACGAGGALYFVGFIGAAVYYVQQATGFWYGVLGILKALVWPAFLVYKLLGL